MCSPATDISSLEGLPRISWRQRFVDDIVPSHTVDPIQADVARGGGNYQAIVMVCTGGEIGHKYTSKS